MEAFTHPSLSHVQLFVAGNGALRERLEARSTPNIHWLGSISREELQQRLSTAWSWCIPPWGIACPNIVKEARVMGLPVITTEEGGQTQYVQDGVSGYIVPVRNSAAIREAAQKLSVSLDKAMSMGMERHQECRRLLDVKQTVTGCLSRFIIPCCIHADEIIPYPSAFRDRPPAAQAQGGAHRNRHHSFRISPH